MRMKPSRYDSPACSTQKRKTLVLADQLSIQRVRQIHFRQRKNSRGDYEKILLTVPIVALAALFVGLGAHYLFRKRDGGRHSASRRRYLLKFPSDVRTITRAQRYEIQPADPEQPSYSVLRVRPRFSSGASNVAFILNDGTIIRTKLNGRFNGNTRKDRFRL